MYVNTDNACEINYQNWYNVLLNFYSTTTLTEKNFDIDFVSYYTFIAIK